MPVSNSNDPTLPPYESSGVDPRPKGLGWTALVLGVVALVLAIVAFATMMIVGMGVAFGSAALVVGTVAIVVGLIVLVQKKHGNKGGGVVGLVGGALAWLALIPLLWGLALIGLSISDSAAPDLTAPPSVVSVS